MPSEAAGALPIELAGGGTPRGGERAETVFAGNREQRVDSCYARDRRTDALAERRRAAGVARHRPPVQMLMRQLDRDLNAHGLNAQGLRDPGRAVRGAGTGHADDRRAGRRHQPVAGAGCPTRSRGWKSAAWSGGNDCEGDKAGTFSRAAARGMARHRAGRDRSVENVRRPLHRPAVTAPARGDLKGPPSPRCRIHPQDPRPRLVRTKRSSDWPAGEAHPAVGQRARGVKSLT